MKIYVDKARLLKRAIIVSWLSFALCYVSKLFGVDFLIKTNNKTYITICNFIDGHTWAKYIVGFLSSMICQCLYELAILQEDKLSVKQFILTAVLVALTCAYKILDGRFAILYDCALLIALPIFLLGKSYKRYVYVLIGCAYNIGFQLLSVAIKTLAIKAVDDSTVTSLIYMIDVYFMLLLYYLYRNYGKEKRNMGIFWTLFAGKPVAKLKEMKAKREKQIEKLNEEIEAIEAEIKKQGEDTN